MQFALKSANSNELKVDQKSKFEEFESRDHKFREKVGGPKLITCSMVQSLYGPVSLFKTISRHARFSIIIFSSMQLNDTKVQEFGRNDGIRSVFHCQDKFFIVSLSSVQNPGSDDTESSLFLASYRRNA